MVFSSTVFLFLFLPVVLGVHFFAGEGKRNGVLLAASLVYYAWGESRFLPLVLLSVLCNYLFGLALSLVRAARARKVVVALAVVGSAAHRTLSEVTAFLAGVSSLRREARPMHRPRPRAGAPSSRNDFLRSLRGSIRGAVAQALRRSSRSRARYPNPISLAASDRGASLPGARQVLWS